MSLAQPFATLRRHTLYEGSGIAGGNHVPCGHPHPDARNIERLIASGYRFLMPSAPRSCSVLEQGRKLAGRV